MWPADYRGRLEEIRCPADGTAHALRVFCGDESFQWIGVDDPEADPRISRLRITYSNLQVIPRHNRRAIVDGQRFHRTSHLISTEFTRLGGCDIAQTTGTSTDHIAVDLRLESRRPGTWSIRVREYMRVGDRQRLEQARGRSELVVGLARKTDDDVRSDRRVRKPGVNGLDEAAKVR